MIDIFTKVIDDRIDLPQFHIKQHKYGLELPVAAVPRTTTLLSDASAAHLNLNPPDNGPQGGGAKSGHVAATSNFC